MATIATFRQIDENIRREQIESLLKSLEDSARKTDPSLGDDSVIGKNREAFVALIRASALVKLVAGWALDHVYGLSMRVGELTSLDHPSSIEEDNHEDERLGSREYENRNISIASQRQLLRNLFIANAGAMPDWLSLKTMENLDDLAYGMPSPLFTPESKHKKLRVATMQLQLRAVVIARFHGVFKGNQEKAFELVANALGSNPNTVRSWETRGLPKYLGKGKVSLAVDHARSAAHSVHEIEAKQSRGEHLESAEKILRDNHLARYGQKALDELAKQFKASKPPKAPR